MAQITEAVRCRGLAPLPCRMSLWELRKRSDAFSAVRPMQQSDLTTCATCSRVWVSRCAFGAVTIVSEEWRGRENQSAAGCTNAKPYQVKQARSVILKAKLGLKK